MSIQRLNLKYMWNNVVEPRLGDRYVWGGSFARDDVRTGTDCSGAVSECLEALMYGPAMNWTRQFWTGTFAGAKPGDHGPFGGAQVTKDLVCVSHPRDVPHDAVMTVAVLQDPNPADAHMVCSVEGVGIESGGRLDDFHIGAKATPVTDSMFNQWFYLPGPVVGSESMSKDTLFADVSEFQVPVNDSYPYKVLSIRVCDGTYPDHKFSQNYAWMRDALDTGKLTFGIVYTYVRPDTWQSNTVTARQMIAAAGGLHPRVALMLDVESGSGNHGGDQSASINSLYDDLAVLTGDSKRIIGYGNVSDLNDMWPSKPAGIRLIIASYGTNPSYPGKVAHQYTNGNGYGGGLPEGCPPFGNCDMNSADGLDAETFAAACGIITPQPPIQPPPVRPPASTGFTTDDRNMLKYIYSQLGPWPQLGQNSAGQNLTLVDAVATLGSHSSEAPPSAGRLAGIAARIRAKKLAK